MKNQRPFFSIAITTFSRKYLLRQAIQSVLNQTYRDFELIIGNDNQQRSVQSLMPDIIDTRIRWIDHEIQRGYFGNVNRLIELSTGEYITTLSDDDLLGNTYLERIHQVISKNTNVQVVFTDYQTGEHYDCNIKRNKTLPIALSGSEWVLAYTSLKYKTIGSYGVFKNSFLSSIGGLKPLGSDLDNSPYNDNLLAVKAGLTDRIYYIPEKLVFFRSHEGSPSSKRTDADAFSSAQKEFLMTIEETLISKEHKENHNLYLYGLIKWFISDYFCVVSRGKGLNIKKSVLYYVFIMNSTKSVRLKCQFFILLSRKATKALMRGLWNSQARVKKKTMIRNQKLFRKKY